MTSEELLQSIGKAFPETKTLESGVKGYPTVRVPKEQLLELAHWLKTREGNFNYLLFLTAVDWKGPVSFSGYIMAPTIGGAGKLVEGVNPPPKDMPFRDVFEVLYFLKSLSSGQSLVLSVEIPRSAPEIPSVTSLWACADWLERQLFDLLGITFNGHPNLKRILTPEFQQGYPLRKDYVHTLDKYD